MPENVNKEVEVIKKQIDKLNDSNTSLEGWKSSAIILLTRIFGADSSAVQAINKIRYSGWGISSPGGQSFHSNNLESCKQQGREILEACINDLETFGIPEKQTPEKDGINITVNQHQTVQVKLLTSTLEDYLTGTQMKELKEIMNSDDEPKKKETKIFDKLKGFGKDVASNILANILTNPSIWGQ